MLQRSTAYPVFTVPLSCHCQVSPLIGRHHPVPVVPVPDVDPFHVPLVPGIYTVPANNRMYRVVWVDR